MSTDASDQTRLTQNLASDADPPQTTVPEGRNIEGITKRERIPVRLYVERHGKRPYFGGPCSS